MAEVSVYLQEGDGSNPIPPLQYHRGTRDLYLTTFLTFIMREYFNGRSFCLPTGG
jgi:hypothetical protein